VWHKGWRISLPCRQNTHCVVSAYIYLYDKPIFYNLEAQRKPWFFFLKNSNIILVHIQKQQPSHHSIHQGQLTLAQSTPLMDWQHKVHCHKLIMSSNTSARYKSITPTTRQSITGKDSEQTLWRSDSIPPVGYRWRFGRSFLAKKTLHFFEIRR
jgi:hypothetical protein